MIKLIDDCKSSEFEKVKEIRKAVFVNEQGAKESAIFDDADSADGTLIALFTRDGVAVATGRIIRLGNAYKIGRVAVLSSERGLGTGKKLIEFLCKTAKDNGANEIFVDSQLHAVPFYEKLGFEPTGEEEKYDIGILHLPMRKVLL